MSVDTEKVAVFQYYSNICLSNMYNMFYVCDFVENKITNATNSKSGYNSFNDLNIADLVAKIDKNALDEYMKIRKTENIDGTPKEIFEKLTDLRNAFQHFFDIDELKKLYNKIKTDDNAQNLDASTIIDNLGGILKEYILTFLNLPQLYELLNNDDNLVYLGISYDECKDVINKCTEKNENNVVEYKKFMSRYYNDDIKYKIYNYINIIKDDKQVREVQKYDLVLYMLQKLDDKNVYIKELLNNNNKQNLKRRKGNLSFEYIENDGTNKKQEVVLSFNILLATAYSMSKSDKNFDEHIKIYIDKYNEDNKKVKEEIVSDEDIDKEIDKKVKSLSKFIENKSKYIKGEDVKELGKKHKFNELTEREQLSYLKREAVRNVNKHIMAEVFINNLDLHCTENKEINNKLYSATSTAEFKGYMNDFFKLYNLQVPQKFKINQEDYIQYLTRLNLEIWEYANSRNDEYKKHFFSVARVDLDDKYKNKNISNNTHKAYIGISTKNVLEGIEKLNELDNVEHYKRIEDIKNTSKGIHSIRHLVINPTQEVSEIDLYLKILKLYKIESKSDKFLWSVYNCYQVTRYKKEMQIKINKSKDSIFNINEFNEPSFSLALVISVYNKLYEKDMCSSDKLLKDLENDIVYRKSAVYNYILNSNYSINEDELKELKKFIKGEKLTNNILFSDITNFGVTHTTKDYIYTCKVLNDYCAVDTNVIRLTAGASLKIANKNVCDYRNAIQHFNKRAISKLEKSTMNKVVKELNTKKISTEENKFDYYSKNKNKKNLLKEKVVTQVV